MKTVLLVCLSLVLLAPAVVGQGNIGVAAPVIISGTGQPIAGAKVAICTANPGANLLPPCTEAGNSLAQTYTSSTLATKCTLNAVTLGPLSGAGCTNPGVSDGLGNALVYSQAGFDWYEVYGNAITAYAAPIAFGSGYGLDTRIFADQYCNTPGTLDDTCFQKAVNAACAQLTITGISPNIGNVGGAIIYAGYGTYLFSNTVTISCSGVKIEGSGMGYPPDLDISASTQGFGGVTYVGATVGLGANPLFKFTSPGGASSIRLGGVGLKGIYMDAQAGANPGKFNGTPTASVCLELDSIIHGVFEQFNCIDPVTAGINFGFVSGITDSQDDQYNTFREFNIRAWDGAAAAANGIKLTENVAATADPSFNTFINSKIYYKNGNGIEDLTSDSDVWIDTTLKKASGGAGHGIHFGSAQAGYGNSAHEEKFYGVNGVFDVLQDGNAGANSIYGYEISNGASYPTVSSTPSSGPAWLFFDIEDANGSSAVAPGGNFPMGINIGGTQGGVAFSQLATLPNLVDGRKVLCTNCVPTTAATCSTNTPAACVCKAGTGSMEAKFENFMNNGDGWYCR